ncbi:MAG: dTDP-4-dehydrorhamnose reductase [Alphaproteobacteria bacterium]|nr:dTDP-4-dehydrorhamnose reductase [Alphaproteobacteria bacterium]MBV9692720.1 dTDP-4-dehydrorhamnose reductase [Alphaproteobacteria bacterium]
MRVLQFGANGQLAREAIRRAPAHGVELMPVDRARADFLYPEQVVGAIKDAKGVDLVLNAVAYTAVDKAETDRHAAQMINAETVAALARACAARGVPLLHISTDYIYDGRKRAPYVETDAANPLSVYGRTKLGGENAIRDSGACHAILRTSWLYSRWGDNFLKTMLRLGADTDALEVVDDQHGAPTAAGDLADATFTVAQALVRDPAKSGTYHCTASGETTWRGFAEAMFERTAMNTHPRVIPISAKDYSSAALRPRNSRLDCTKLHDTFGIRMRPWRTAMTDVLAELHSQAVIDP